MLSSLLQGLGLGLSLIVAIGAQNLFVLRQGLRRQHVLLTAGICAVSDALLIVLGVSGVGLVLQRLPGLLEVVRWAGAVFLAGYGVLAARRALWPDEAALTAQAAPQPSGGGRVVTNAARSGVLPVVGTCLALTWLNPHVYLDTVFLLGGVANTHGDDRWVFAAGAMVASVAWFLALGFGAHALSPWLSTARAWRLLDGFIALVMLGLAVGLVVAS